MQTEDRSGDIESMFIKGNSSPGYLGKQQENYVSQIKIKKQQLLKHQSMTGTLSHSGKKSAYPACWHCLAFSPSRLEGEGSIFML